MESQTSATFHDSLFYASSAIRPVVHPLHQYVQVFFIFIFSLAISESFMSLTTYYSHMSAMHLLLNCLALEGFGSYISRLLLSLLLK